MHGYESPDVQPTYVLLACERALRLSHNVTGTCVEEAPTNCRTSHHRQTGTWYILGDKPVCLADATATVVQMEAIKHCPTGLQ